MSALWSNTRELWSESAWFRVTAVLFVIGSCIIVQSARKAMGTASSNVRAAQNMVQKLPNALGQDVQLTPQQEQLARQAVDSMTVEQQRQYAQLLRHLQKAAATNQP